MSGFAFSQRRCILTGRIIVLLFAGISLPVSAQVTGRLATVSDPAGAAVPSVTVTARRLSSSRPLLQRPTPKFLRYLCATSGRL